MGTHYFFFSRIRVHVIGWCELFCALLCFAFALYFILVLFVRPIVLRVRVKHSVSAVFSSLLVHTTCKCSYSAFAALFQGVPLSLQLQFTNTTARLQRCNNSREASAKGDKMQPLTCCSRGCVVLLHTLYHHHKQKNNNSKKETEVHGQRAM